MKTYKKINLSVEQIAQELNSFASGRCKESSWVTDSAKAISEAVGRGYGLYTAGFQTFIESPLDFETQYIIKEVIYLQTIVDYNLDDGDYIGPLDTLAIED